MKLLNRLSGYPASPAGMERPVLRAIPRILVYGIVLLGLPSLLVRLVEWPATEQEIERLTTTVDIYALALLMVHLNVVVFIATYAIIIMVMKGPGYVADAYPLEDADAPAKPLRRGN
ncbi:hypothetical protein EKL30_01595 [Candidimonas sp. SYP-B2681]|uniref:hypothetical protein n=1 Tax=Candidimonas sp. SYP-B2681 TaxID=2497686 RepID=UPI000F861223|nr:hypothetical protein [Candidimonas sp. SYP-B2681]RTZ47711.1 hypothetical protein EKL30_01595 [Candidimonas sp. SYP-B2681]